ncbi:hypothetical protein GDO86_016414 [Hymenochirus boettgeri]|uniref:Olfactory receptor n=1 Tax=Hymenochirus boettgeri TaxID=247094 RepID=A0A8T2K1Z8_9PIPI|nr:hypothetical protein GDO86_016414 [Hymenochirus boettgeri]
MSGENHTMGNLISLLGFEMFRDYRILFFLLSCFLYCLIITINIIVSALIYSCPNLHHPMFFFLGHLSFCDITLTTVIVPLMLPGILRGIVKISFAACITQLQIYGTVLSSECLLLVVMSFDRYLAICHPLRYTSIMNKHFCLQLVTLCWTLSFTVMFSFVILLKRFEFCGTAIDHFICDYLPVLKLSCTDISSVKFKQLFISSAIVMFTSISLVVTYSYILKAILKITSISGRKKAFSTCSSHMAVVGTFLGSLYGIYIIPHSENTLNANKVFSLLYTFGTPLFNPLIYCVKNIEIRGALKKCLWQRKTKKSVI